MSGEDRQVEDWLSEQQGAVQEFAGAAGAVQWHDIRQAEIEVAVSDETIKEIARPQLQKERADDFAKLIAAQHRFPYSEILWMMGLNEDRLAQLSDQAAKLTYGELPEAEQLQRDIEVASVLVPAIEADLVGMLEQRMDQIVAQRQVAHAYGHYDAVQVAEQLDAVRRTVGFVPFPEGMAAEERAAIAAQTLGSAVETTEPATEASTATMAQLAEHIRNEYGDQGEIGVSVFAALVLLEFPTYQFKLRELGQILYGDVEEKKAINRVRGLFAQSFTGGATPITRQLEQRGYALERGWADDPETPSGYSMIIWAAPNDNTTAQ